MQTTARILQAEVGTSPTGLRILAAAAGCQPHGRQGQARRFSTGDSVRLLIVARLMHRGFAREASVGLMEAMAVHFERLLVSHEPCWLLAWAGEDIAPGWSFEVHYDQNDAMEIALLHPDVVILNVTEMMKRALWQLLRASRNRDDA